MADAYFAVAAVATGQAPYADLLPAQPPRPGVRRALATVLACIGLAYLSRRLYTDLTSGPLEPEASIRYALVTTLGVYALVAAVLVYAVRDRLHWRLTPLSLGVGAALGGGLALVMLGGDVSTTDPRIALLVSEASVPNIAATVLVTVVAAPVCEEILFRGLMLESFLRFGRRPAVWASGFAFAAWHLMPSSMVYYTLFGTVFGALYLRRGLACSMAAHAAFNGTLTAAAVVYALGSGVTVSGAGLVLTAPPGWHDTGRGLHLSGPSAGQVFVETYRAEEGLDLHRMLDRLVTTPSRTLGFTVRDETARIVKLPVAWSVRARVTSGGRDGELVMFSARGRVYAVTLMSGGSPRVRADFEKMLRDLRLRY